MSIPILRIPQWMQPAELVERDPAMVRHATEILAVVADLEETAKRLHYLAYDLMDVGATRRPNPDYDPAKGSIYPIADTPLLRQIVQPDPGERIVWGQAAPAEDR